MLSYEQLVIETADSENWDCLLRQFDDANYRQLAAYSAAAARRVGAASENVVFRCGESILGLSNIRIRKLPLLPFGIAYVNGGPLVQMRSGRDTAYALRCCLAALRDEYVKKRGHVLRIVGVARRDMSAEEANRYFLDAGFEPSAAKGHYRTALLDIGRDLADVRRSFDQKWRNVLNKAERQELDIVCGTGKDLFLEFDRLFRGLVERKKLSVDMGPEFFSSIQDGLAEQDRFVVHLAMRKNEVVAGHVGAFHGDTAVYLLGAANEVGLSVNASYLLQWRVIEYAMQHGCRWYDLGGIDPEGNPDVYRFKMRMGGEDICAPGPYEIGSRMRRSLVSRIESLYRIIKK